MYAYEVDGLGNHLTDFDDPNLPSLLALPLLGYGLYDRQVWNKLVWNGVQIRATTDQLGPADEGRTGFQALSSSGFLPF